MTKKEIRILYKQKRLALTEREKLRLDDLLLIQLQRLAFDNHISTVMSFSPLEKHGEMNMPLYNRYFEHILPHVTICLPVIDVSGKEILVIAVNDETEFAENRFGILEPVKGEEVLPEDIDVVLVPLLAFDSNGYRVGYGKGFYDRFLNRCRKDVIAIGFSYFEPVDKIEDTHQFDVPLNYCITPESVYEF